MLFLFPSFSFLFLKKLETHLISQSTSSIMSFVILQAEEDQEDRDERWDPDSDMEVDEERYFIWYLVSILFYLFNPQHLNLCFPLAFWTENPSKAELKERQLNLKSKIRYVLSEYRLSYFCSCPH